MNERSEQQEKKHYYVLWNHPESEDKGWDGPYILKVANEVATAYTQEGATAFVVSTYLGQENVMNNSLDSPFPAPALEVLREYIHRNVVCKYSTFARSDYQFYWDILAPNDISVSHGSVIHILLGCNPFNGPRSLELARRAITIPRLRECKKSVALVKRVDAGKLWGIDLNNVSIPLVDAKASEVKHFKQSTITHTEVTVTLIDDETKKKVSITLRDGDAFTAFEIAYKRLYSPTSET